MTLVTREADGGVSLFGSGVVEDSELAKALPLIERSIVRLQVGYPSGKRASATGFICGVTKFRRFFIATARHVVPGEHKPGEPEVTIAIERLDSSGIVRKQIAIAASSTNPTTRVTPWVHTNKNVDIGCFEIEREADCGSDFLDAEEVGVPLVSAAFGPAPGTRIAWAGYPALLEQDEMLGTPTLCYFEGVVSAIINTHDKQTIVVDGHALPGVSGGPMWFYSEPQRRVVVAGIISCYAGYRLPTEFHPEQGGDTGTLRKDRMPGFCFVQPVYSLIDAIAKKYP